MKWKSRDELREIISELEKKDKLFKIYAMSLFIDKAFYTKDYTPVNDWADAVVLSATGDLILNKLNAEGIIYENHICKLVMFKLFYHNELFIDYENTDDELILSLLIEMHKSGNVLWPYTHGNLLYHKFNDNFIENKTDFLNANLVENLLQDTPQGIFQVGSLLSGPLGFVFSAEKRELYPKLSLDLWHCPDPGCLHPHRVNLEPYNSTLRTAELAISRCLTDNFGPASEWHWPILEIDYQTERNTIRPYKDLPAILSDCIVDSERSALCLRALRSPNNGMIQRILAETKNLTGSPEHIVSNLTAEEQHQLLLLISDRDLINYIDELVSSKTIKIPPSELRTTKSFNYTSRDIESELSSLGLRSPGHPPVIKLSALICNTYDELGITEDLAWRIRGHSGTTLRHSVVDFIRSHGPVSAVRELVLPTKSVTDKFGLDLVFNIHENEDEINICNRLLWKCGFNLARFEDEYTILRDRITEFRNIVLQLPKQPNESDQAKVRSIGVNLFVSVEVLLENILCYNMWLLSSDHFTGTDFSYSKNSALLSVSKTLGYEIESGLQLLRWSDEGHNTLGTLLGYINAFKLWLSTRISADKTALVRDKMDYPHFANESVYIFPFKHTALWADIPVVMLTTYLEFFDKMCTQLAQADLAVIRNGIDHKRDEDTFPDSDKMLACATRLLESLDIADSMRFIPKLYWGVKSEVDADGNNCITFSDYRNATIVLWTPSPMRLEISMPLEMPHLIAPFDLLNLPNSSLAFFVSPQSSYRDYWQNYPRRADRQPPDNEGYIADEENDD